MNNNKVCFVIMPFSSTKSCTEEKWTEIFDFVIKPAVEESGLNYDCERSAAGRGNIIKGILDALNKANVVIADLTDNNPNVFYELGVRHTLANCTVLIAQGEEHVPFDLKPYPVVFYDAKSPAKIIEFKKEIKSRLEDIERKPDRPDNPVADFLQLRNVAILAYEKKSNLAKLSALILELSYNASLVSVAIFDGVEKSEQMRKRDKGKFSVSNFRFSNSCLELLLSTSYLVVPKDLLTSVRLVDQQIRIYNAILDLWGQVAFTEQVEQFLKENLPAVRTMLMSLVTKLSKLRLDYTNDNYQEPKEPII